MTLFQSLGIVALLLLIVRSSSRARYAIMASPTNFRISPGTSSSPIDLFLPIAATGFLIKLMLMAKEFHCFTVHFNSLSILVQQMHFYIIKH
jgi:hypothetical protein